MSENYCVNCFHHAKHYEGYDAWSQCSRLLSDRRDLVTGERIDRLGKSCASERRSKVSLFGRMKCGPDAVFYREARP